MEAQSEALSASKAVLHATGEVYSHNSYRFVSMMHNNTTW